MRNGYGQFCPVAKASEIFATRWTPLVLRELMSGLHGFNDLLRALPLISRAVLVTRLRELEDNGVIERRPRADGSGHDYWLTSAGEALGEVVSALGRWGLAHGRERITRADLDPALLVSGLQRRVDVNVLPDRRIVLRFEFSGVPAGRTKFRIMWLLLDRSGADICVKNPGFPVDLTLRGDIRDFVMVYLGHAAWRDLAGKALRLDGSKAVARQIPAWLKFDKGKDREAPTLHSAA
jgi:DNA-binding HxlR family transcriptional regulator